MNGKLKLWQLFGILSGFSFLYTLFFPFIEIYTDNPDKTEELFGYEYLSNLMLDMINSSLTTSISEMSIKHVFDYLVLVLLVMMIMSLITLLWTSISSNIILASLSSIIYGLITFFIILILIDYSIISSFGTAYYLFITSSISSLLLPISYKLFN